MDEQECAELLEELIGAVAYNDELVNDLDVDPIRNATVRSYTSAMVLTGNAGFIVTMADGSEFQVTVVRSK